MRNKDLFRHCPCDPILLFCISVIISFFFLVFGVPVGEVSPVCSSLGEFEAKFNVNGFLPNSFCWMGILRPGWGSKSTMHGFFATNSTGGFENKDAELRYFIQGEHTMFIYDDIEHDYVAD